MTINLAVLVSVGVHPLSGRPRRADLDARAVEFALRLAERHSELVLHFIHAGRSSEVLAREYLGMGIDRLTLLKLPEGCDPLRPIAEHLARLNPAITLAGLHSEAGEGSGFLPYALAETLGLVMAPAIVELALEGSRARLVQAISGGMRRLLSSPLPLMVTVDKAAPEPRQSAYSRARRGRLDTVSVESAEDITREVWRVGPAQKRGRLTAASGANLTERLALITDAKQVTGERLVDPSGDKAARGIRDFLRSRGLLNQSLLADHNPRL